MTNRFKLIFFSIIILIFSLYFPAASKYATSSCIQEFNFFGFAYPIFWVGENIGGNACRSSNLLQIILSDSTAKLFSIKLKTYDDLGMDARRNESFSNIRFC